MLRSTPFLLFDGNHAEARTFITAELSASDCMAAPDDEPTYGDVFAIFVLGEDL